MLINLNQLIMNQSVGEALKKISAKRKRFNYLELIALGGYAKDAKTTWRSLERNSSFIPSHVVEQIPERLVTIDKNGEYSGRVVVDLSWDHLASRQKCGLSSTQTQQKML